MDATNIDLHSHSRRSDGDLEPEEVAQRAADAGVTLWALTDHDEIDGLARARAAARKLNLNWCSGVEISVARQGHTIHIVGLNFDPENEALKIFLNNIRDRRLPRAREMAAALARLGIPEALEGALKFVSNPQLISRTHFAKFLVSAGYCRNPDEVFSRYLGEGCPAYIPSNWADLEEAVRRIIEAGGVAVLAHPGRYRLRTLAENALFEAFCAAGGRAVEVITSNHNAEAVRRYTRLALRYGLAASRGSDFHRPSDRHAQLGRLPPLPPNVTPITALLRTGCL